MANSDLGTTHTVQGLVARGNWPAESTGIVSPVREGTGLKSPYARGWWWEGTGLKSPPSSGEAPTSSIFGCSSSGNLLTGWRMVERERVG